MALIRILILLCVVLGSTGQVHAAVCTSDSDPKNDPYVQGAVKLGSGLILRDQCQTDGTLVQVDCQNGVYGKTAPTACPVGSACTKGSGACQKLSVLPKIPLIACTTDSDPANDPFVTGAVKLQSGQIVKDQCLSGKLVQVNCLNHVFTKTAPQECPAGNLCPTGYGQCYDQQKLKEMLEAALKLVAHCGDGILASSEQCDPAGVFQLPSDVYAAFNKKSKGALCLGYGICLPTDNYASCDLFKPAWFGPSWKKVKCTSDCEVDPSQCYILSPKDKYGSLPVSGCGNWKLEAGEQCDGPHMKGMTCEKLGYFGGDLGCSKSSCQLDTSGCFGGPGDPYGAPNNDPNYVPACGNGALDAGEACDSAIPYSAWKYSPALKKQTCEGLGYYAGQVFCSSSCQIAKEYCYGIPGDNYAGCGDGKVSSGEQCDCGVPLYWYKVKGKEACMYTKASCKKFGFYGGALYCNTNCGFVYSECDGWGSDPYGVPPDKYAQ